MTRALCLTLLLLLPTAAAADWWDGFAAPPAGEGLDGDPRVLLIHDDDLYAGGSYLTAGGDTVRFLARWTGDDWSDVGGGTNHRVDALVDFDGDLVAGGRFTAAGGVPVAYVAVWDGQTWSALGASSWAWGYVLSLCVHDGKLYAGGTGYVVTWDGAAWQRITGAAFTGDVFALASFGGALYAGGAFSALVDPDGGPVAAANVARWAGAGWSSVGGGADGTVYALRPHGTDLIAGGVFHAPGRLIAGWTGASWYAPGGGLTGTYVIALADWSAGLVVGGDFSGGGAVAMTRIGVLSDGDWWALGDGVDGMVRCVAARGAEIYAGGAFTHAGGTPSLRLARWDDPDVGVDGPPRPGTPGLSAPFPNPANPGVTIPLRLDAAARTVLDILDLRGRRVRRLWDGPLPAGARSFRWDGLDDRGRALPSGVYVAHARTDAGAASRRFILAR